MTALYFGEPIVDLVSFNMHGLNQESAVLSDLCLTGSAKIIMIQELWQSPANMNKI